MTQSLKVIVVIGTRPEAIKLAPVVLALQKEPNIRPVVIATAQHREMLDQVLNLFKIVPDYDLDLMIPDQTLFDVTGNAIKGFENILKRIKPDFVVVQGDTTTTFMGALAGFYLKIPIGHVEAGLRTGNKYFPFPEEMNRKMVSVLTDLHFAPTESNKRNLLQEGYPSDKIFITGNTVIDALLMTVQDTFEHEVLKDDYKKLIMITAHRRENFGDPLRNICKAVRQVAEKNPEYRFVYPVHLNNNVQKPVSEILTGLSNVKLLSPLDYFTFVNILDRADLVLTDSGGVQEEAPSLGKPVLVLRNETERPEAVEAGTVKIVGTIQKKIIEETLRLLTDTEAYQRMSKSHNPYGDGKASGRIVDCIKKNIMK